MKECSNRALAPLIKYAQSPQGKGTIQELSRRLTKLSGETVYRQQVQNWINPDKDKRVEPKLGIGLLLVAEGSRMIAGDQEGFAPLDLNAVVKVKK